MGCWMGALGRLAEPSVWYGYLKNNRRILVFLNMSKPGKPGACSFSL